MPTVSSMTTTTCLGTYRALLEHQHGLAVHCTRCERWGTVNLARLVLQGHGDCHWHGATFRCIRCGGVSTELQVRPPVPVRDPAVHGWVI